MRAKKIVLKIKLRIIKLKKMQIKNRKVRKQFKEIPIHKKKLLFKIKNKVLKNNMNNK